MTNPILLEICVFSLEAAIKASRAGADRIELCSNPLEGGTTPCHSLIKTTCRLNIPVYPIIRPRGGNFCYTEEEFEMMKKDIRYCKKSGAAGIAIGILTKNNRVDEKRVMEIVELASPLGVTFIRAFDLTPEPIEALDAIIRAGCKRILTSGQAKKVIDGLPLIKQLNTLAGNRISIMPGSGINHENLKQIIEETGVAEVHASARIVVPNNNPKVNELDFGNAVSCDENKITEMRRIADDL